MAHHDNIVVMEYIGTEDSPAPMMKSVALDDPEHVASVLLEYMRRSYQDAELVHGDLSEYNVLMDGDDPVIIDVGQSVLTRHPLAEDMLVRDVTNMARFFRKYDLNIDVEQQLREIRKR